MYEQEKIARILQSESFYVPVKERVEADLTTAEKNLSGVVGVARKGQMLSHETDP